MKNVKSMENLDKLDSLLRQNPHGIRITDAARKLNVERSTVYDYLRTLDLKGLAHYEKGIAYPGTLEKNTKSTETQSSQIRTDANTKDLFALLLYYRTLEKNFGSKVAGETADTLEDLSRKFRFIP